MGSSEKRVIQTMDCASAQTISGEPPRQSGIPAALRRSPMVAADPAREAAHRWFGGAGAASWATCPITENGVIRIVDRRGGMRISSFRSRFTNTFNDVPCAAARSER